MTGAGVDWGSLGLDAGVLAEAGAAAGGGGAVWTRLGRDRRFEYWDRIVARPGAGRGAAGGVRWAPATASAARTRRGPGGGRLGRALARLARGAAGDRLAMPDGREAERRGGRRTGLALAWTEDGRGTLDEGRLEGLWGGGVRPRRLGARLFLVAGVAGDAAAGPDDPAGTEDAATTAARLLGTARAVGDRSAEAAALADLGAALTRGGRPGEALGPLRAARALRRALGDRGGGADALVDLGAALDALGRPVEARGALEAASALADGLDAPARAAALERLGAALAGRGDPAGAAAVLGRALAAAREAGDRRHEARLLWLRAAAWAEAGRPGPAAAAAGESAALLRSIGAAEADWFEAQSRRYRPDAEGPGALRMALTAARAMATFLGTGARTTTAGERGVRLAACRACVHRAGLRCRICGCFTAAKAALPHERCPIGRW